MKTKTKANKEYLVPVPEQVWVVVGTRGGVKVFRDEQIADTEWWRQQQLALKRDTGSAPMLVKFVPDIARSK